MKYKSLISSLFLVLIFLISCSVTVDQNSPAAPLDNTKLESQIPVTWTDLNLTGRLVYIYFDSSDYSATPSIRSLDLTTGKINILFQTESGGWIYYLSASPDGKNLVISYIPPSDGTSTVSQALYTMPVNGSTPPQLLFSPPALGDQYIQAEWSPDGRYIYYVHVNQKLEMQPGQLSPVHTLYRIAYSGDTQEKVADNAFWPRLSPDASKLVYISSDPFLPKNLLYVANADGSDPQEVVLSGSWIPEIKDAPMLLPDGQTIIFSAQVGSAAYEPNWLDKLMGVQIVKAHSVPSDWWSVPVHGGEIVRLTKIQAVNLFASLSPDKAHIVSLSGNGLFVMNPDGSNLTQLLADDSLFGSIAWIP